MEIKYSTITMENSSVTPNPDVAVHLTSQGRPLAEQRRMLTPHTRDLPHVCEGVGSGEVWLEVINGYVRYAGRIWPLRLGAEHLGSSSCNLPPTLLHAWEGPGLAAASLSRPVPGTEAAPDLHTSTSSGPFHGPARWVAMLYGSLYIKHFTSVLNDVYKNWQWAQRGNTV